MLRPKERYSAEAKDTILKAYGERMSLRGVQRVFGVWRGTVLRWLKQLVARLPRLAETLLPAQAGDVIEMDELASFVSEKFFKRWLWTALCRRTRQIVAYAIGDRSESTARHLWQTLPEPYRACTVFTDDYNVYPLLIPSAQHHPIRKGSGQTNHQERWYNSLRQRSGRYTRRSLSFSKNDEYHNLVTLCFIIQHNLRMRSSRTM